MLACIVCGKFLQAGLVRWHASCPGCQYERAALEGAINGASEVALDEVAREAGLKALRQENFRAIVTLLQQHGVAPGARVLDVGSAHGWFLEVAAEQYQVLGVEPDATVGARAAQRGLPVRAGYFPDALADDERFDVIVFNDVFEHIPDLFSALRACHARLNDGGLLILNLPSSRGLFYRLSKLFARLGVWGPFERLWQKGLPSPHLHYFNPHNLAQLVAARGFTQETATELPSLRLRGLLARLRCAGNASLLKIWVQYLAVLCLMPLLKIFPSDIIVGVFRKRAL